MYENVIVITLPDSQYCWCCWYRLGRSNLLVILCVTSLYMTWWGIQLISFYQPISLC